MVPNYLLSTICIRHILGANMGNICFWLWGRKGYENHTNSYGHPTKNLRKTNEQGTTNQ